MTDLTCLINVDQATQALLGLGIGLAYVLLGIITYLALKDEIDEIDLVILIAIFWPFAICAFILYWMVMWLIFPLIGATKKDLKKVENKVDDLRVHLPRRQSRTAPSNRTSITVLRPRTRNFVVGDLLTAAKVQTTISGGNANYQHLGKGCVVRVVSIDREGIMNLVLVDHKDYNKHRNQIGQRFTAPSRNFVLYQKGR